MKAARIHRFGGPEVIQVDDVQTPEPGRGELRVRVLASSVNPVDWKIRQGGFVGEDKLPITLGRDVCGTVDALGADAVSFELGDTVFAMLPFEVGGNAEFAAAKCDIFAPKPDRLDPVQAGSLGLAALTAWQGIFDHGGLRRGQRILIHGAAGGVGHLAVQFAAASGAEVFATCAGEDVDFVRSLGARVVIDYKTQRFEDLAKNMDVVFDLVAGETQDRSWSVLREGGIIVSTLTEPDRNKASEHGARGAHYMAQPNGEQLREVARLIDDGVVTPHVARVLSLAEVAEAHRLLQQGHVRGKVVLRAA